MRKLLLWFRLLIKRQLKNPFTIALLIGLPILTAIAVNIPHANESGVPTIGIVTVDDDELTYKITDYLVNNYSALNFITYNSQDELHADIQKGNVSCGYIFSENLTQKLDNKSYKGSIILLKSSSEFITSLSNEVVFASLFREYAKNIALNYIQTEALFSSIRTKALELTANKYDYYINGAATFHIDFNTLDTDSSDVVLNSIEVQTSTLPIRGVLSVLVFVAGIFGCIQWFKDFEHGVFAPMSYTFRIISRPLYILAPTLLFAISMLATLLLSGTSVNLLTELVSMIIYVLLITIFGLLLSCLVRSSNQLIVLTPILIICSLILCPIFVDIRPFLPISSYINKLLVPHYYLQWFF